LPDSLLPDSLLPEKAAVLKKILLVLKKALQHAIRAADQAHATATHSDNVAENKYDTLGQEAAYLAHGQSLRIQECELEIEQFSKIPVDPFAQTAPIAIGALIELQDETENSSLFFLGPGAAGLKIIIGKREIVVVTPAAPLGKALLGRQRFDEINIKVGNETTAYEIIALC